MPKLHKRQNYCPFEDYSHYYIRTTVEGEFVTYQVLWDAEQALRKIIRDMDRRLAHGQTVDLDKRLVFDLWHKGYLKTKAELTPSRKYMTRNIR